MCEEKKEEEERAESRATAVHGKNAQSQLARGAVAGVDEPGGWRNQLNFVRVGLQVDAQIQYLTDAEPQHE